MTAEQKANGRKGRQTRWVEYKLFNPERGRVAGERYLSYNQSLIGHPENYKRDFRILEPGRAAIMALSGGSPHNARRLFQEHFAPRTGEVYLVPYRRKALRSNKQLENDNLLRAWHDHKKEAIKRGGEPVSLGRFMKAKGKISDAEILHRKLEMEEGYERPHTAPPIVVPVPKGEIAKIYGINPLDKIIMKETAKKTKKTKKGKRLETFHSYEGFEAMTKRNLEALTRK